MNPETTTTGNGVAPGASPGAATPGSGPGPGDSAPGADLPGGVPGGGSGVALDTPPHPVKSSEGVGLIDRIGAEAEALAGAMSLASALYLLVLIAGVWLITRAITRGAVLARQLGLDPNERVARAATVVKALIWLAVAALIWRQIFALAPFTTVGLSLVAVLMGFTSSVQSLWIGLGLIFRPTLHLGDRVTIGEHSGVVREIGLGHIDVGRTDGSVLSVPNRLLGQEVLTIERAHNTVPVQVEVILDAPPDSEAIERARQEAILSPYRLGGSPVQVDLARDGKAVTIGIQVWSAAATHDAHSHLTRSVNRVLLMAGRDAAGAE